MHLPTLGLTAAALAGSASAIGCPYMGADIAARDVPEGHPNIQARAEAASTDEFMAQFELNDTDVFLTSDVGGPFSDQNSLSAGERGPTLLEDFIFRQKIQHFDHERVPERAVHARGAAAHGVFTSYADWSNITGASFLAEAGKETPVFLRFSTVAGSRGSADTARDVHGFAVRLYTDEGNFDIVGNNIPVFFIQDAILFPDLIHAVKPSPDSEIPQAATAHDSAWDFFSQQPSTLHTLFWAMAQHGIVRSFRHMDGFGVHTFRFVTDDGASKLVKFHWKSLQGKAGLTWEEAQVTAGKNADFHRQDLFESIEKGRFPEWELGVQIVDEGDDLRFGFDVLDPTKIIPEEYVPVTPLGKMTLNRNPRNYFAETEQVMFQPGHIVRGVDFSDDPLLQGRIYSYLDTQLNRHGGPNFEQLPINQPRVPWHNNNRDGAGQHYIPLNTAAYSPNTLNNGYPKQATQEEGRGFFTAPNRSTSGKLVRAVSSTFNDVWSQPRLFFNSLNKVEQQFLVNAIRFETSKLTSKVVQNNVLIQLNRVSHDIAERVAQALGMSAPAADPTYYHDNTTASVRPNSDRLPKLDGLKVGILTSINAANDTSVATIASTLAEQNVDTVVVAESLISGVDQTYAAADATDFDAVFVAPNAASIVSGNSTSTLFPAGRPGQILLDAFRYGKTVGALGSSGSALTSLNIPSGDGVFKDATADDIIEGLTVFKHFSRFPTDN
ncbi:Catalase [Neofusicoccum parvum]|uniref:Catalase n=1 Tax=Botryosphaeria parva (strain UCR-NP2) TaxID=1287680 RepID=R1GWD3_BOTPV|nr:putative catalase protein [Neofusicoccum parvum UCRNP2]GME54012.1 Catalase [Neofusicoccum parvum]